VLNPYSLLSFFSGMRFYNYWYVSGSPKFLLDFIKKDPGKYTKLKNVILTEYMLDAVDIDKITLEPLLFQTGYLTVKAATDNEYAPIYTVDMPNHEVRDAFNLHILSALSENDDVRTGQARLELREALDMYDLERFLDILRGLFASIPYNLHIPREAYYHSVFYSVMTALGFDMDAEVAVSGGRIDAVLETRDRVYIMEFKYVGGHQDADAGVGVGGQQDVCAGVNEGGQQEADAGVGVGEKRKLADGNRGAVDGSRGLASKALDDAMAQIESRGYHRK
jgi:hypothetical protein